MAKIDTTLIAGYAEMTAEEKLAALENFEIEEPTPDYTGYVRKDKLDKATHDAAEWKRKYNAQLSEEEQARQKLLEENEALKSDLSTMKRDKDISTYTAKFASQGYEADLATATATAMVDGDMETVFANQQKFIDFIKDKKAAEDLKATGKPGSSGDGMTQTVSKADFLKMSYADKLKYKADHPDWASELK